MVGFKPRISGIWPWPFYQLCLNRILRYPLSFCAHETCSFKDQWRCRWDSNLLSRIQRRVSWPIGLVGTNFKSIVLFPAREISICRRHGCDGRARRDGKSVDIDAPTASSPPTFDVNVARGATREATLETQKGHQLRVVFLRRRLHRRLPLGPLARWVPIHQGRGRRSVVEHALLKQEAVGSNPCWLFFLSAYRRESVTDVQLYWFS